jgi:hypothetical protein
VNYETTDRRPIAKSSGMKNQLNFRRPEMPGHLRHATDGHSSIGAEIPRHANHERRRGEFFIFRTWRVWRRGSSTEAE